MDSTSEATEEAQARPDWRTWDWWREGYHQKRWFIIGTMALITVVLALFGLGQVAKSSRPPYPDRAYDIVNLFHFSTPSYNFPLPLALEVARWLAPLTLILAGLGAISAIFKEQLTQVRVYFRFRNHLVICGAGRVGMRLTATFREKRQGEKRQRVVMIDHHPLAADVEECRRLGVPVLTGDATDPVMLKRARVNRAEHLIAVSGDNGVNAEIALQVANVTTRKNHHLTCYVNVDDQELSLLLDETARFDAMHLTGSSGAVIDYRFFNILQQGPETLLRERQYVLEPGDGAVPSLLVVGGGPIAIGLVLEAARQWQKKSTARGVKLQIAVADADAEALAQGVHQRSADLDKFCDLVPLVLNPWDPYVNPFVLDRPGGLPTPTTAIVCPLDDAAGLRASIKLWNRLPRDVRIIVCTTGRLDTAPLLQLASVELMHNVEGFPILDRVCKNWVDLVIGTPDEIEVLAKKVHETYLSHRLEDPEATLSGDPSLATWDSLPEDLRQSNREQVVDFKRKLQCIGLTYGPAFGEVSDPYVLSGDQIEELSKMEHDRWTAERLAGGWTYGQKDVAHKINPSMVCWTCLTTKMQDFDRNAMREFPALLSAENYVIGDLKGPPDPDGADQRWELPSTWSCPHPNHNTETLARAIHDDYRRRHQSEANSSPDDPSLLPWDELPEALRESNRSQAADIDAKLAAISYEAVTNVEGVDPVTEFSSDQVEQLARLEHDRWVSERIASGWTPGPTKDVEAKRSPYLVPWEELTEEVRDLDRDTVRRIPQFLAELELVIVHRHEPAPVP